MISMKLRIFAVFCFGFIFFVRPALANTTLPQNLTIAKTGAKTITVPIFDKWTDGATIVAGDLGGDGVPEIVVGAGPGSLPEIDVLRQDGSLITKFNAFDKTITKGVIVGVMDANNDGKNEIVAALGPGFGKFVRVFDGSGKLLDDWFPIPESFNSILSAATIDGSGIAASAPTPLFTNQDSIGKKEIIVNLAKQRLYAYENGKLFTTHLVSTGKKSMPTIPGLYSVLKKIPTKTMGRLKNIKWDLLIYPAHYIHAAYWHNDFGKQRSEGCINEREADAKKLYDWAQIGTTVKIIAS
jgi:lipoprotein-anchoring transpeptidase ErfK/SrfK